MDPVTHTMTGAALGRGGLDRWSPLATPTLVLAANAPDVDVAVYAVGPYAALALRRGLTHGLPAMVLLPLAVTGAVLAWDVLVRRRRRPSAEPARAGPLLLLSAVGLLTHPVLDWMNTYGLRWLVPFSDAWTYGDALFIVDPWIWLALGAPLHRATPRSARWAWAWWVFWALAAALVLWAPVPVAVKVVWGAATLAALAWIGRGRKGVAGRGGRRALRLGTAAAVAYVMLMVAGDLAATHQVRTAAGAANLGPLDEVMVAPMPADPLAGDVVIRTGAAYVLGAHRWLGRPPVRLQADSRVPVRSGVGLDRAVVERAARAASADPRARDFLRWSRFPRWRVVRWREGYRVRIFDLRYEGAGSLGGLTVELDGDFEPAADDDVEWGGR